MPVVLMLILVTGVLAANAMQSALTDRTLATTRQLHQQAFELAEMGAAMVVKDLQSGAPATEQTRVLPLPASPGTAATVSLHRTARHTMPEGFSAGKFEQQHWELTSVGRAARAAAVTQTQGLRRITPVVAP
jgi:Tfp pilus assembly protein PilX